MIYIFLNDAPSNKYVRYYCNIFRINLVFKEFLKLNFNLLVLSFVLKPITQRVSDLNFEYLNG